MKTALVIRQVLDLMVRDAAARGLVPCTASTYTFAHNYLAECWRDAVDLAMLLGHISLDTMRIYSQPSIEQLSTGVEQLRQNAYKD